MTDLATLVEHKNRLKEIIPKLSIDDTIYSKVRLIDSLPLNEYHEFINNIRSIYVDVTQKNKDVIANIEGIINAIDNDISKILESKTTTIDTFKEDTMRGVLPTNDNIRTIFNTKINKFSQVKYPGLMINSKLFPVINVDSSDINSWINCMVSSDPLYLIGPIITVLQKSLLSFPEIYQKRVRLYELNSKRDLSILPQAQFNIIFCWDFFNYLPIDVIDFYLHQMIRLLKPGGTLLFTYNNCDLITSAKLVDWNSASWITPPLLEKLYSNHGFKLVDSDNIIFDDFIPHVSWVELKRPGNLTTSKISQASGLIRKK